VRAREGAVDVVVDGVDRELVGWCQAVVDSETVGTVGGLASVLCW
jgi:hypothetical protein